MTSIDVTLIFFDNLFEINILTVNIKFFIEGWEGKQ